MDKLQPELLLDTLMMSQCWPGDRMLEHQHAQLEQLLWHARAASAFYRDRLRILLRSDGSIDWGRWTQVPILTRAEALAHSADITLEKALPDDRRLGEITTSGTTGAPFTVVFSQKFALMSSATKWRSDIWHGVDWSQTLYSRAGDDAAGTWPGGSSLGPWGPPWIVPARQGRAFRLNKTIGLSEQLRYMARVGAHYAALGNPKHARALAQEAERQGQMLRLNAIFVNGERMDTEDQNACRRAFGAIVIDLYSSKEGGHIAHRCPDCGQFHVNAESVLVEIVDTRGLPVPAGEVGRVVITPLFNSIQPLFRYDQGDLAVAGVACSAGRSLPSITEIVGRHSEMFSHPDGRVMAGGIPESLRTALQAVQWQFAQTGPLTFECRYIPRDTRQCGDERSVVRAFRSMYFSDAELIFRRLDRIPVMASGKFVEYVNEYRRGGAAPSLDLQHASDQTNYVPRP